MTKGSNPRLTAKNTKRWLASTVWVAWAARFVMREAHGDESRRNIDDIMLAPQDIKFRRERQAREIVQPTMSVWNCVGPSLVPGGGRNKLQVLTWSAHVGVSATTG